MCSLSKAFGTEGNQCSLPNVLGTKVRQDLETGEVTVTLDGYISALADTYKDYLRSRTVHTPATQDLERHVTEALLTKDIKWFQSLTGALLFAAITCRPDISWATAMLSRAMCYPTPELV